VSRLKVQAALELAVREHQSGRLDDAMALYQHVLTADPKNPDALHLSGMIELARGHSRQAINLMQRALESTLTPPPHFRSNLANAYREAGEFERAESEYRAAIASGGGTPEVFNNLGLTLVALGRPAWAIEPFEASLTRRPRHAGTLTNLSVACLAAGAIAEALRCADEALETEPELLPARLARAAALAALDRHDDAEDLYRTLLETNLAPAAIRGLSDLFFARGADAEAIAASQLVANRWSADPTAWLQHSTNLARAARVPEAESAAARACACAPTSALAHSQHGALLLTLGRARDAIAPLQRATELAPTHADTWSNLSSALIHLARVDQAVDAAQQAARWSNRAPGALAALGAALLAARRFAEAEPVFRELIAAAPAADAWNGLGVALERCGRIEDATQAYARALALEPTHTVARLNHAETLLLSGDFESGWKAYESRLDFLREAGTPIAEHAPRWKPGARRSDGSLPRVLLITEQGLGDALQFVRYAAVIRREAAGVIVRAPDAVRRLLATAPGVDEVIGPNDPAPTHDFSIPATSMPLALGTTLESVPALVPYLTPAPTLFRSWAERLDPSRGLRVALAWAGSPRHSHDASRSIPLAVLHPLSTVAGVQWFSVQKGPGAEQLATRPTWPIADLGPELEDMSDTAAALAHMDLVITVDTSVSHLAGAIGARTWTLLAHPPEWRWLLNRRDTPWYPTMTLFRQRDVDQWQPVVARVRHRLERLVCSKVS
jgi:Flp pilus assembly protein TadD